MAERGKDKDRSTDGWRAFTLPLFQRLFGDKPATVRSLKETQRTSGSNAIRRDVTNDRFTKGSIGPRV